MYARLSLWLGAFYITVLGNSVYAATPTAYLEDSAIAASGKTIDISRLPVTDSSGKTKYVDIGITLAVDPTGKVSFAAAPTVKPSPSLIPTNFIGGRYYVRISNKNFLGRLTSAVGAGGSTIWTLTMDVSAVGHYPTQAIWQTGAPNPDVSARIAAAKIRKNPNYSYGVTPQGSPYGIFYDNGLLAAEQVNGALTLISYSAGSDTQLPNGSIILGLCVNASCTNAPK